jgi:hypothetical protein
VPECGYSDREAICIHSEINVVIASPLSSLDRTGIIQNSQ